MNFWETIETRKTIRKYKETMPSDEDIKKIANAGRLAPSATNSQNWKFIAIKNKSVMEQMKNAILAKYDELVQKHSDNEEFVQKADYYKAYSTFFVNAPIVFAIVEQTRNSIITEILEKDGVNGFELKAMRPDSSLLSMGAAIENMSLAAHNLGYGTCWMAAPVIAGMEFIKILNLKEGEKVCSLLTLGEPFSDIYQSPPKKSLEEVFEILD